MTAAGVAFWVYAVVLAACAALVATGRDPARAAMALILAFVSAAGLFVLANAEFLGLMLLLTYAGAVMTLFLFVVMTLDVAAQTRRGRLWRHAPMAGLVAGVIVVEAALGVWAAADAPPLNPPAVPTPPDVDNARALGQVLYTRWFLPFQLTGVLLLATMAGAIALALRAHRRGPAEQSPDAASARTRAQSVRLTRPPVGEGVDLSHRVEAER